MKLKIFFFILLFLFTYLHSPAYSLAKNTIPQKSRVILKVKDNKGINNNVYFFASKEKKTDYYLCSTGDEVYIGDYRFAIQKEDEKEIRVSSIVLKNYPYNKTQKTVFPIRTTSKLYPDIVLVSEQVDCNTKVGHLYYIKEGNLVGVKSNISYILPPRFNSKYQLETMNYYNMEELPWVLSTYSLDIRNNTLKFISKQSLSNEEGEKIKSKWQIQ